MGCCYHLLHVSQKLQANTPLPQDTEKEVCLKTHTWISKLSSVCQYVFRNCLLNKIKVPSQRPHVETDHNLGNSSRKCIYWSPTILTSHQTRQNTAELTFSSHFPYPAYFLWFHIMVSYLQSNLCYPVEKHFRIRCLVSPYYLITRRSKLAFLNIHDRKPHMLVVQICKNKRAYFM